MANTTKNFLDTMMETQQKMMDSLVDTTKKMTNNNSSIDDIIKKGTDVYKNAMEETKKIYENASQKSTTANDEVKNNLEQMNSFFKKWYEQQVANSKNMYEMNLQSLQQTFNAAKNPQNMMDSITEMFSKVTNNNNFNMNNWMSSMNPSAIQDNYKKAADSMNNTWNGLQDTMKNMYNETVNTMNNSTTTDAFKGMFHMADGFSKFHTMWSPILNSIQNNSFSNDSFKQMFDVNMFKSFMDQFFSFMPKNTQEYMNTMNNMYTNTNKSQITDMMQMFNTMQASMQNMMPASMQNPMASMLSNYNNMYNQMNTAASPFSTLFQSNSNVASMGTIQDMMHRMNVLSIKNAELQQMVYNTGISVMEKMAKNVINKVEHGEEIKSTMSLYQEFLNMSDTAFVELFETDSYSQLMAEVSAMQLRLKKDMQVQTEKMFENLPLITRSEMDELYKTIYDLKKEMRGTNTTATTPTAEKKQAPAKKSAVAKKAVVVKKAAPVKKQTPAKKVAAKKVAKKK